MTAALRALARGAALAALLVAAALSAAAAATSPAELDARFRAALAALEQGRPDEAIRGFREILSVDPNLPRVRLELARAYYAAEEWSLARETFFEVLSGDLPAEVRANILRFLRAIDARRGWSWGLDVAVGPGAGFGRSYNTDIIEIEDIFGICGGPCPAVIDRRDPAAFVVSVAGTLEGCVPLGLNLGGAPLFGFVTGAARLDDSPGAIHDEHEVGATVGVRAVLPQATVQIATAGETEFLGLDWYESRFGLEAAGERRSRGGLSLFAAAAGYAVDNTAASRDGALFRGRLGLSQSVGGRARVGSALRVETLAADADFESYLEWGAELFASADLGWGVAGSAALYGLRRDYDAKIPGLVSTREDWEAGVDARLTKRDLFVLGQYSPYVFFGVARRGSSIPAFGYDELRGGIGFERAF